MISHDIMAELRRLWPGRPPVMRRQRFKIICHPRASRNLRMIRPAGGVAFIQGVCVEKMSLMRELHAKALADDHEPLMRPIGFIGTEQIDIAAQITDIGKAVRGIADPIDNHCRAIGMGHCGDRFYIIYGGYHIGTMGKTDKLDLIVEQLCQILQPQIAGFRVDCPFAHLDPLFGQPAPDAGVGLMVLICHDNRLSGLQPAAHSIGQHIGVGAGRRAKRQFMPGYAQHRR